MTYTSSYYKFAMENIGDDHNSDINESFLPFGITMYGINDISVADAFKDAFSHVLRFDPFEGCWICKKALNGDTAADACMLRTIVELRKKLEHLLRHSNPYSSPPDAAYMRMLDDLKIYERQSGRDSALRTAMVLMACDQCEVDGLHRGEAWE